MAKPPSPYVAVSVRLHDANDWVSFPPFHAHVASVVLPNGDLMYAPRIRDSDGLLRFLSEPNRTAEQARRVVDAHWWQVRNSPQEDRDDFQRESISHRWEALDRLKAAASELTPPDAQSPYKPITLGELRQMDPYEYPKGYPIVVKGFDPTLRFPDIVVYRTQDNRFRDYHEMTYLFTRAEIIIKELLYGSTIPDNFIEYCDVTTQNEYRQFMRYR